MNKLFLLVVFTFLIYVPFVFSQTADIDPLGSFSGKCLNLTQDLRLTSVGSQVFDLQFFLQSKGYLNSEPTGYFGFLTQNSVIKYQITKGIVGTGFVGPITRISINKQSCDLSINSIITATSSIVSMDKKSPSITIEAKTSLNRNTFTSNITIEKGEKFNISGTPKNLKGLNYGSDGFMSSWNFGSILEGACSNTKMKATGIWKLNCKADRVGSTDVYVEIYKDGKTYISNKIKVNIIENESENEPIVNYVQSPAEDKNILHPGERATVYGSNFDINNSYVHFLGKAQEEEVKAFNLRTNNVDFIVPNLFDGIIDLHIKQSNGVSNIIKVEIVGNPSPFYITFPSSNAILKTGQTYNIRWTGGNLGVDEYAVYLVGGALGDTNSLFLGTAYSSQHSFSWTVPFDIQSSKEYQIQFSGKKVTGGNSESFTINQ